ncbi:MAG: pyridoxal phosphate-dependent aminotransferase [Caldilineae bacterium]|nr:MAG: pyridoxal phosphate-dependent aminotransferase [Caldilineae bacterium]
MKPLSQLLSSIPPSATLAVNDKAKALKAAGRDVISLAGGDPDFDTPAHIVQAAFAAIEAGDTHYPPSRGTMAIRKAVADKMAREYGLEVDPASQVLVSPGGKFLIYAVLAALSNPGDEIIIFEPYWVSYVPIARLVGATPVTVTLRAEDGFTITAEDLAAHITPRTKAILVNSPNNPTGRVITRAEAEVIREAAIEHDLYVLSDEMYEKLIFEGEHINLASLPGMAERTVTVNGHSKAYAMTGWRLGWAVGPADIIGLAAKLQSQSVTSAASFTMAAGAAALNGPQDVVEQMRLSYKERRDYMVAALNAIPGVECDPPQGAFYLFVRFPGLSQDSMEIANRLLEEAEIAATPGIAFGQAGEGHVRFSIATAMTDLRRAVERIEKLMASV